MVIRKNDLESWVRRSLGDDARAEAVRHSTQAAFASTSGRVAGEDRMLGAGLDGSR